MAPKKGKKKVSFKDQAAAAKKEEELSLAAKEEKSSDGSEEKVDDDANEMLEAYIKEKSASKDKKEKEAVEETSGSKKEEVEIVEEGEEVGYVPKLKPELDDETKKALKLRAKQKKQQPNFRRQEWFRYKRLGESWRRPKGLHSKARMNFGYRAPLARIGYRKVSTARGLHPSGFQDILVHNLDELKAINPKIQAARIASSVGYRKRLVFHQYADDHNIRILNRVMRKKLVVGQKEQTLETAFEKIDKLDPKTESMKIHKEASDRKRKELQDYARNLNIRVSNWKEVRL